MGELSLVEVLGLIPHRPPFRFIDTLVELDDVHVMAKYTFRPEAFFYGGHFPGNPITPGVILTEAMCQMGLLPLGIRALSKEAPEAKSLVTVLTDAETEYYRPVLPGTTVICRGKKIYWRRRKIRARLELTDLEGNLLAAGSAAGIGVTVG